VPSALSVNGKPVTFPSHLVTIGGAAVATLLLVRQSGCAAVHSSSSRFSEVVSGRLA
jgi:hypothetical protein